MHKSKQKKKKLLPTCVTFWLRCAVALLQSKGCGKHGAGRWPRSN